jgi:hypothetical protein
MTPAQLERGWRRPDLERACRAFGQDWFERTRAGKDARFSEYIGQRFGWQTKAATSGLSRHASSLMGRLSLEIKATNHGPFAASARRVLAGRAPRMPRLARGCSQAGRARRRRQRGQRRGEQRGTRCIRGPPGDGDDDEPPAGRAKARLELVCRRVAA